MSILSPSMPTPLRILSLIAAVVVTIGVVRPAFAQAPFCDPRGATNHAPPPFTQIPDVRWEVAADLLFRQWCDLLQAARSLESDPGPVRDRFSEYSTQTGPDMGSPYLSLFMPRRAKAQRVTLCIERSHAPPGYRGRVYRPPR